MRRHPAPQLYTPRDNVEDRCTKNNNEQIARWRETPMKRRDFLKMSAVGTAVGAVASPAIAQSSPELKWRLASSFPKSLDTLYGGAQLFVKQVAEMTDNKFQIQPFAAGEIVPGLQALDAASNGTVEIAHTSAYYYVGKDPTFAIYTAVPFGLNTRMQNSWWYQGGGDQLGNEFLSKFNVIGHPAGNTGTQMGGWFRKEIKSVADLSGVKMRIAGIAGQVLQKVGVVPQQLAGGDVYPAIEKGTIDAAEWVGPYDDEKLGLQKVAKFYYYPGFWEGSAMLHNMINLNKWNELPKHYQSVIASASANANLWMSARYDLQNPAALKRLVAGGTQLKPYPVDMMEACLKATNELWGEISAKNADFKKSIVAMQAYRNDQYLWWQVAEHTYDSFMIRSRSRS
jgi:TRAP-type mannitol/chloroaromatic compound transport system substrate-binding protein